MAQRNVSISDSTRQPDRLFLEFLNFLGKKDYAYFVFMRVLAGIEIPVMILTLIALCFIVKSRPAASVFIGHLILSDLIQVISMLTQAAKAAKAATSALSQKPYGAFHYSLIAGLYFMACVSFERYLLVSHPIWYKSHQSLKLSCFISVIIWCVPLTFAKIQPPYIYFQRLPRSIALLIPYPIIILCFVGTCRGLSRSISLTALQRKLILGSLFLVLLTYTFLILPAVIMDLIINYCDVYNCFLNQLLFIKSYFYAKLLLHVNPLADCVLYLFMRPDVGNMMNSVRCCCCRQSLKHNQDEHSEVNPQNSCSTVVCCISAQKPASVAVVDTSAVACCLGE